MSIMQRLHSLKTHRQTGRAVRKSGTKIEGDVYQYEEAVQTALNISRRVIYDLPATIRHPGCDFRFALG